MRYDYKTLKGIMIIKGKTPEEVAKAGNMHKSTFSQKINNHYEFSQGEISGICKALNIDMADIGPVFFSPEVQEEERKG